MTLRQAQGERIKNWRERFRRFLGSGGYEEGCKRYALFFGDMAFMQQVAAQIPWKYLL
ncbi:MAG: hypothetical protein H3C25_07305 [Candidatus Brocadia sapporoensis]|nr:hypothetical protein [Candidatus Brocadia sapporoensis]QQR66837.1 MAG: hypothetical protein IPI25_00805 [Candidatus Brocadia sp.]